MKIGIDISQIAYEGTGTGTYFKNLALEIPKIDFKNKYVFFAGALRRRSAFSLPGLHSVIWPLPPSALDLLWNRLHILPVEKLIGPIDVFHSSDWTQPPSRAKKVAPILDMVVYKFPESSHPKIVAVQKRRLAWVKREADCVITISQSSKMDIVEILGIPEDKIKVIYLAATPEFRPDGPRYNHPKPYILAVGTREPRKNLARLIAAFKKMKNKDLDLIIAGKYGWGEDIGPGVINLGYVPQKNLPTLFRGAKAFVYPSLYEGFGVPILEALSCGIPVICGRNSSMPEVGGDAVTYADVESVDDLASKIKNIKKTGLEISQSKKFSWKKTAEQTVNVYEELA